MSDWFKKITDLISEPENRVATPYESKEINKTILTKLEGLPDALFESTHQPRRDLSYSKHDRKPVASAPSPQVQKEASPEEKIMSTDTTHDDDNIKALKRLRELPRGTQVDSRIAAIHSLLGEGEIFKTLKMLRWPQGVICPRCHSSNIVRRDPPPDAADQRHYYVCLNCKGDGSPSDFDDFTGLPIGEIRALRQWILCWYLIGFCSVAQIAKVLGISIQEVMQIATLGNELTQLPDNEAELQARVELKDKKTKENRNNRARVDEQEEKTRSASLSPLKPGYKSKK